MKERSVKYQSFIWCLGSTSFRTKNISYSTEQQLGFLDSFWKLNYNKVWNVDVQKEYYDYLFSNNFIKGNAPRKAKDAREKTAALVDFGFLDTNRKITDIGYELITTNYKDKDNIFMISSDSFIWFKQLLKVEKNISGNIVRPGLVICSLLNEHNTFSYDIFKYLVPLCVDLDSYTIVSEGINSLLKMNNDLVKENIDKIILKILRRLPNLTELYNQFSKSNLQNITLNLFDNIILNRKSTVRYSKSYYELYVILYNIFINNNYSQIMDLLPCIEGMSSNIQKYWKQLLFNAPSNKIRQSPKKYFKVIFNTNILEEDFNNCFFWTLHLIKTKTTLDDYADLNIRYLKTTDCFRIRNNTICFEPLVESYMKLNISYTKELMFKSSDCLNKNISLEAILGNKIKEKDLVDSYNKLNNTNLKCIKDIKSILYQQYTVDFKNILDNRYSKDTLLKLLELFKNHKQNGDKIKDLTTYNADLPTIFEYIIGIIWFKLSDWKGTTTDFLKLSLDNNFYPKSHAVGGQADIICEYGTNSIANINTIMLEVTLATSTGQRNMEVEPVSRHLGNYLLKNRKETLTIFCAPKLNNNLISDFRLKQSSYYYGSTSGEFVKGLTIIPLDIDCLIYILNNEIKADSLLQYFHSIINKNELHPLDWWTKYIKNYFS